MTRLRRLSIVLAAGAVYAASAIDPVTAAAVVVPAGHLAFVTASGALDITAVMSDGTTTPPVQLAPVTKVSAPRTVKVSDLVVSADKNWLAWSEEIFKPDPMYGQIETGARIAVRDMYSGKTITVKSDEYPLGFSGHTLVCVGAYTKRLVMKPSPHLVRVPGMGDGSAVATYQQGVVDVVFVDENPNSDVDHEQLRLTTFAGHHTVLHQYDIGKSYRNVTANSDVVSPSGKKLLIERGNHQDFDGLGPSSLFDTYSLGGAHVRHQLGHYGSNKAQWRLVGATFVGPHDTPWLALHGGYIKTSSGYAVHGIVVRYVGGKWLRQSNNAIAVTGNSAGYVVVQPGKWVAAKNSPDGEYDPTPTGPAGLEGPGGSHFMPQVEGSQMVWVVKTYKNAPEGM